MAAEPLVDKAFDGATAIDPQAVVRVFEHVAGRFERSGKCRPFAR